MSWIARLAFVPIGISIADACTVVDTIKAQNTAANARILKSVFRLVKMTALGIALIVIGLTLVCGSMIFSMFSEPSSSEESFDAQRTWRAFRGWLSARRARSKRSQAPR